MAPRTDAVLLLVATKKGLFVLRSDDARENWSIEGPHYLGHVAHHAVIDPRDRKTLLLACKAGHLGPTIFRSLDFGATWTEVAKPPAFPKQEGGRSVGHVFWLQPSSEAEPGVWYAGTSPPALFRSEDSGNTWSPVSGWNDHVMWGVWTQEGNDGTPDGSILHSINVDPRDPKHLYLGISGGGVFESTDGGADWAPLNENVAADFKPDRFPVFGQDPHCVRLHPANPDILWMQNHCGIYRLERPSTRWERVGDNMPREVGDIGFPIGLHPRDANTAWVFPMDGSDVWPRTSPGGRPAAYRTRDAGVSWQRLDRGLPHENAWLTVFRQAMTVDASERVGVYFGTTTGQIWASRNEGDDWRCIAENLPHVYAVEAIQLGRTAE